MTLHLTRAFQSKVARRVALLFFACAMVPLAGLAVVTSVTVEAELDEQARDQLGEDVKNMAMWGLGQLDLFEGRLRLVGAASAANTPVDAISRRVGDIFPVPPAWVAVYDAAGMPTAIRGEVPAMTLSAAEQQFLERAGRLVSSVATSTGSQPVLFVISADAPARTVAAAINVRDLFGLDAPDEILPPQAALCLSSTLGAVGCSANAAPSLAGAAIHASPDVVADTDGNALLVQQRTLPLRSLYGAPDWTLTMARPQSLAREPVRVFLRNSWAVALLTGLIVTWISVRQIRRQLRPLDELTAATERLAQRQFDQPVRLASQDEFEDLGNAFNDLADRLRRQFAELDAFSMGTLSALARAIDAKSPWTAGHSDRVTAMSVAIAREMGLPEHEITELERGGLVHDIGKLATPPGILDKPGRLTPEEFAVMREHPAKGVHILEPIPAFRPLLPIVGQHHERWDGAGYPDGLAGLAIARTARVLAVADVYDAVGSDRPYRPGMPQAQVIDIIREGAGSHFDPDVVAAFLRVVARDGRPVIVDRREPASSMPLAS